jgi:cell division septum initiation protein DivIVA
MKLNVELTGLNRTNEKLKEQLDESQAEASNYKNIVYGLQRKIQRIQGEAFETNKIR